MNTRKPATTIPTANEWRKRTRQGTWWLMPGPFDLIVGIILVITIARVVAKEKASRARAEELHRQLQAYAGQIAELATTRERNRLARSIHDTLGHYLTVINVQLEKSLAVRDKKPREADQAVSDAKRVAREALQEVRQSVGALRATADPPPMSQEGPSLTFGAVRQVHDGSLLPLW